MKFSWHFLRPNKTGIRARQKSIKEMNKKRSNPNTKKDNTTEKHEYSPRKNKEDNTILKNRASNIEHKQDSEQQEHIQTATVEESKIENKEDIEQQEDVPTEERKTEKLARQTTQDDPQLQRFFSSTRGQLRRNALTERDQLDFRRLRTKRVQQQVIDTYVYGWK